MTIKMEIQRDGKAVDVNVIIVKGEISRFAFTPELDHAWPLTDEECAFAENLALERMQKEKS